MRTVRGWTKGKIGKGTARTWAVALTTACAVASAAACSKSNEKATDADSGVSTPAVADSKSDAQSTARGTTPGPKKILFAGTSLTAGLGLDPDSAYPMLIQRKIDSAGLKFEVINAGVSGETSSGLLDRLDWLLRGTFDVLVLETGANDGLRGIPPATLKANLEAALDRLKSERPEVRVVLVQMEALPNLGPKYASEFHDVYPSVAKAKGVTLLPFLLQDVAGRRELNQGDGVHPNDAGERIVAENVWRGLSGVLGEGNFRGEDLGLSGNPGKR